MLISVLKYGVLTNDNIRVVKSAARSSTFRKCGLDGAGLDPSTFWLDVSDKKTLCGI